MYSRYDNRQERPIRLPENYSGTAFSENAPSQRSTPRDLPPPMRQLEIGKPSPPPDRPPAEMPPPPRTIVLPPPKNTREAPKSELPTPYSEPAPKEERIEEKEPPRKPSMPDSPLSSLVQPFHGLFGHAGHTFPFAHGIGFDELLIIGLIVLLSRNEQDSDVIVWLALLLFCG